MRIADHRIDDNVDASAIGHRPGQIHVEREYRRRQHDKADRGGYPSGTVPEAQDEVRARYENSENACSKRDATRDVGNGRRGRKPVPRAMADIDALIEEPLRDQREHHRDCYKQNDHQLSAADRIGRDPPVPTHVHAPEAINPKGARKDPS
ncbi:hypothetical protein [Aldersonia kunmingensis]|uniref:hypothetical protein n=1 Tax=Aldersonia kunmingensis TaxID=408066 RepID=UPI0012EE7DB9|nr:hypothetical protein [Aldersonia kunmingensis]